MDDLRNLLPSKDFVLKYPVLYTTTKSGKKRLWSCWLDPDHKAVFRSTDGEVGGKLKDPASRIFKGNTRRTPSEQTEDWAQKKWIQKLDKGYQPDPKDEEGMNIYEKVMAQKALNGGMNRGVKMWGETHITTSTTAGAKDLSQRHYPMLAKKYKDHNKIPAKKGGGEVYGLTTVGKKITFPCFVQTKVDGVRALPRLDGERVILESRNGKDYVHLNHIRDEVRRWLRHKGCENIVLDGEMYIHSLIDKDRECKSVERFQFLSRACKITRTLPHPDEHKVQFHIFDLWDETKTFRERWAFLQSLFEGYDGDILKLVPTYEVSNHSEIEHHMRDFVGETSKREGYEYEGLMVRQSDSLYVTRNGYHCSDLLKYKRFEDEEWEIYDAEPCAGNHAGAIKWKLKKVIDGKERKVCAKQGGDLDISRRLMTEFNADSSRFIGELINIRFNDRSKDKIPRFPSATAIPEDKF